MKGKLKLEDKIWYVVYEDLVRVFPFHQYTTREIPIRPESLITQRCVPGKEVEFDVVTIDNGDNGVRYAKLKTPELKYKDGTPIRSYYSKKLQKMMEEINSEENPKGKINEMKNKTTTITYEDPIDYSKDRNNINLKNSLNELNYPLDYKIIRDCEFCGEKVKEEFQPVCDDCREALKDLVLERKKYNNKYKTGDNK